MRTIKAGDPVSRDTAFCDWLVDHGIKPEDTYEVTIGKDRMRVCQFDRREDGSLYVVCTVCKQILTGMDRSEHDTCPGGRGEVATRKPFTVKVKEPAPC